MSQPGRAVAATAPVCTLVPLAKPRAPMFLRVHYLLCPGLSACLVCPCVIPHGCILSSQSSTCTKMQPVLLPKAFPFPSFPSAGAKPRCADGMWMQGEERSWDRQLLCSPSPSQINCSD